jgi:hypothetical protein
MLLNIDEYVWRALVRKLRRLTVSADRRDKP